MDGKKSEVDEDTENEQERSSQTLDWASASPLSSLPRNDSQHRPHAPAAFKEGSSKEVATSEETVVSFIDNPPKKPIVTIESTDGKNAHVKWDAQNPKPSYYLVHWEPNEGDSPKETEKNELSITLNAGTKYLIWVEAVNRFQQKTLSDKHRLRSAPQNLVELEAVQYDDNAIEVTFKDPNPAGWGKKYKVTGTGASVEKIEHIIEEQFCIVEGLVPNVRYTISVQAIEKNEYGSFESDKTSRPFLLRPLQPTNIKCDRDGMRYRVAWDGIEGASDYKLDYMDGLDAKTLKPKIPECYLDLAEGQHYEIRVSAVNDAGESKTEVLHFDTNPLPPTDISAEPEKNWIRVTFKDSSKLPKTYTVVATAIEGHEAIKHETETHTCLLKELRPGIEYEIYVIAEYNGKTSTRARYKTPVQTRLLPPSDLECHPDDLGGHLVTWRPVVEATKYILRFGGSGNGKTPKDLETMTTEIRLTELEIDQSCEIRLYSVDDANTESAPEIIRYYTGPSVPMEISVKVENASIRVSFKDSGESQKTYKVVAEPVGGSKVIELETEMLTAVLDGLEPGKEYAIHVTAECNGKKSSKAKYGKFVRMRLCSPTNIKCKSDANGHLISWDPVLGAKGYILRFKGEQQVNDVKTEATETRINAFNPGQVYDISVYAVDDVGAESTPAVINYDTGPSAPTEISVEVENASIRVSFEDSEQSQKTYTVVAKSAGGEPMTRETEMKTTLLDGLEPGKEYEIYVIAECNGKKSSKAKYGKMVRTRLSPPTNLKCSLDTNGYLVSWDPVHRAKSYRLRFKGKQPAEDVETDSTETHVIFNSGQSYDISVYAVDDVGAESTSAVIHYDTGPSPPSNIDVKLGKDSVKVSFRDDDNSGKTYTVIATPIDGDEPVQKKTQLHTALLSGLKPTKQYEVWVFSKCHGKERKTRYGKLVRTLPEEVQNLHCENRTAEEGIIFEWNKLDSQEKFEVQWRVDNDPVRKEETDVPRFHILPLEPARCYSVRVMAMNSSGNGPVTNWVKYIASPKTPTGLKMEILSPTQVRFICDETAGATKYVFDINGVNYKPERSMVLLNHDNDTEQFEVWVSAENMGGRSPESSAQICRQTLLILRNAFIQKAKNRLDKKDFINPELSDFRNGNAVRDFGTGDFYIGNGETVCIEGGNFFGKTACCAFHLQNIPEDKIGIFLNWGDYKDLNAKLDVKSFLRQSAKRFGEREWTFTLEWMKSHSDKVVFAVDDLNLPDNFARSQVMYDDNADPAQIFYSLVSTNREIFPQSQVLCALAHSEIAKMTRPSRILKIVGFGKKQIQEAKTKFYDDKVNTVPRHLEYLCANPGYCKIILRLLQHADPNVDIWSSASVIIKLLREYLEIAGNHRKVLLDQMVDKIKNVAEEKLRSLKISSARTDVNRLSGAHSQSVTRVRPVVSEAQTRNGGSGGILGDTAKPSTTQPKEKEDGAEIVLSVSETLSCGSLSHDSTLPHATQPKEDWSIFVIPAGNESLSDDIIMAMHLSLFCPVNKFKTYFHKSSITAGRVTKAWVMAAGLLQEGTANCAIEVLSLGDSTSILKKRKMKMNIFKDFIHKNISHIRAQIIENSQIALDWYDIIAEMKYTKMTSKSSFDHLEVKKSYSTAQLEHVVTFLRQVRVRIVVKFEDGVEHAEIRKIETAIGENPFDEIELIPPVSAASNGQLEASDTSSSTSSVQDAPEDKLIP